MLLVQIYPIFNVYITYLLQVVELHKAKLGSRLVQQLNFDDANPTQSQVSVRPNTPKRAISVLLQQCIYQNIEYKYTILIKIT